jgi:hypothetical protein
MIFHSTMKIIRCSRCSDAQEIVVVDFGLEHNELPNADLLLAVAPLPPHLADHGVVVSPTIMGKHHRHLIRYTQRRFFFC